MKAKYILLGLLFSIHANASMVLDKTRIIFPQGTVTEGLTMMNMNNYPSFVQAWIDKGDVNNFKQDSSSPFIIIPPIFNLGSQEIKSVKIIYDGRPLPTDRESLYWVNIYEVPAIKSGLTEKQYLLMSIKMQIKLIYRPETLKNGVDNARKAVDCSILNDHGYSLSCKNNSGYYISYNNIFVNLNNKNYTASASLDLMIPPFSESQFSLNPTTISFVKNNGNITFIAINDKGESESIEKKLSLH